jgi:hypothetical protein
MTRRTQWENIVYVEDPIPAHLRQSIQDEDLVSIDRLYGNLQVLRLNLRRSQKLSLDDVLKLLDESSQITSELYEKYAQSLPELEPILVYYTNIIEQYNESVQHVLDQESSSGKTLLRRRDLLLLILFFVSLLVRRYISNDEIYRFLASGGGEIKVEGDPEKDEIFEEFARHFKNTYGLKIFMSAEVDHHGYNLAELTIPDFLTSIDAVKQSMYKYPPDFFRNNEIYSLRFASRILDASSEEYTGLALYDLGQIVVAFSPQRGDEQATSTLDHELFHHAEQENDSVEQLNQEWEDLHPPGYQIYEVIEDGIAIKKSNLPSVFFAEEKGRISAEEDRAHFAKLVLDRQRHVAFLAQLEQEDDPVVKRVLYEKYTRTLEAYYRYSNGRMDDHYWQAFINGEVDEKYFHS